MLNPNEQEEFRQFLKKIGRNMRASRLGVEVKKLVS